MSYYIVLFLFLALFQSCGTEVEPPPPQPPSPEPYFKKGEYGGQELPGTEHLTWISPSPDGEKMAVVRKYTPGQSDPLYQLWIMDADGTNAELVTYNTGSMYWHPNGGKIVFNFNPHTTPYLYVFTYDLETKNIELWNSKKDQFFDKYTSASAGWFDDGERILIGVNGKAYQQKYERGVYILNVKDSTHSGPERVLFSPLELGNNNTWTVGIQYTNDRSSSNRALYNLKTNEFKWLTTYDTTSDSLRIYTGYPEINPTGREIILPKFVENAWQLFHINENGENVAQLTELGGHEVTWTRGKDFFIFNRDTHKAPGARYIPYKYNFHEGTEEPLWPNLPESVPSFPEFTTQNPIHLINYVD
ncbi:MAG: hypothetical protein WC967_15985 [Balneolaceae bacterium]